MVEENKRKAVFAGTFDPPTLGHKAMIEDALALFDEVVVAVMVNPLKTPCFTVEQRKEMLALDFSEVKRVRVIEFSGTVAELLEKERTKIYIRGIRNGVDLDFENANFYASKKLDISSSMVRNSLQFGTPIDEYVSEKVKKYIHKTKERV